MLLMYTVTIACYISAWDLHLKMYKYFGKDMHFCQGHFFHYCEIYGNDHMVW